MRTGDFRRVLRRLLLAGVLALAVRHWVWKPLLVVGTSMQPTLPAGSIVGLNQLAYRFGLPQRGDIVALWTGRQLIVKRILGLPGEEILAADGVFYINGSPLAEPYVQLNDAANIAAGRLGANRFVVAGDNRRDTIIAVASLDRIVGRVKRFSASGPTPAPGFSSALTKGGRSGGGASEALLEKNFMRGVHFCPAISH
jgi:signal peptidase I